MNILPHDTFINNRYQLVRQIGRGGMGAVYEAVDQRLGNTVALKQTLVDGDQFVRAFEREARLLAGLRHPHLPKVTDFFTDPVGQFLVMEFIPGADLATLLHERGGPFPVTQVLDWADQLLDALEFLHAQTPPIIHRDIKPQNLKLTPRGEIILLDFGLAKSATTAVTTSSHAAAPADTASVFGYTPHYAPLEQIQGTGTDARSDLYALAVTLHHLLTGTQPANALERATAAIEGRPDPLLPAHTLNPQVPLAVSAALGQALALNRAERPSSATVFRAALRAAHASPTVANTGATIVVPQTPTQELSGSGGLALPLTIMGVLALVGLVAVTLLVRSFVLAPEPNDFPTPPPGFPTVIVELPTPRSTVQPNVPTILVNFPTPQPTVVSEPTAQDVPTESAASPSLANVALHFGDEGTGTGLFQDARGVALDGAGNIYVSEYTTGRIQKFDSRGKFLLTWTMPGDSPLLALAADRAGRVYVARDQQLYIYDGATGKLLSSVKGNNRMGFQDVVVLPDGKLLAAGWGVSDDLIYLEGDGHEVKRISKVISGQTDSAELNMHVAVDGLGRVFVLGSFSNAVFQFTPEGKFVNRFGSEGDAPGQFRALTAGDIAIDNQSRVYVSDSDGIQIFDANGRYLDRFETDGVVRSMAFNDQNELFVVTSRQHVQAFTLHWPQ